MMTFHVWLKLESSGIPDSDIRIPGKVVSAQANLPTPAGLSLYIGLTEEI
jgi:hypothetical protein